MKRGMQNDEEKEYKMNKELGENKESKVVNQTMNGRMEWNRFYARKN